MNKTKIDWCDMTWNPVTGCLHGCEYCYARGIAQRFKGFMPYQTNYKCVTVPQCGSPNVVGYDLVEPLKRMEIKSARRVDASFPFGFTPTFHRYRLDEPARKNKPQTIFVCSMADLFGEWVPDEWIRKVFEACERAPQHRYLFLTKNPKRYTQLANNRLLSCATNFWYGSTATTQEEKFWRSKDHNTFVSIEPMLAPFDSEDEPVKKANWIIIGAETGSRKNKVIPKREWIENITQNCRATNTPIFMKESLRALMGDDFIQEYPWEP